MDIWVGTLEPKEIVGILCVVDTLKRDAEIKILYGCTAEEVETVLRTQNATWMQAIFIPRRDDLGF